MLYLCGRKEEGFTGCAEGGVSPSSVPLQVKLGAAVHSVLVGLGHEGQQSVPDQLRGCCCSTTGVGSLDIRVLAHGIVIGKKLPLYEPLFFLNV